MRPEAGAHGRNGIETGHDLSSKTRKKQAPITRHRLFPVITALWCAAALGFGSFVVRVELLSQAVGATGLAKLVPAAAPPLGFTARALLALALTGIGATAGYVIGRALGLRGGREVRSGKASPKVAKVRARDAHPDAPARKPFMPSEHIVEPAASSLPADQQPQGRRRALAITDEAAPLDIREFVPLPGSDRVEPLDLGELLSVMDADTAFAADARSDTEPAVMTGEWTNEEALSSAAIPEPDDPTGFAPEVQAPDSIPAADDDISCAPEILPELAGAGGTSSPVMGRNLGELGILQLVERLALAMARYNERHPGGTLPGIVADVLASRGGDPAHALHEPEMPRPLPVAEVPAPAELPAAFAAPGVEDDWEDAEAEMPGQTARFLAEPVTMKADGPADLVEPDLEDEILIEEEEQVARSDVYSSLVEIGAPRPAPFAEPAPESGGDAARQVFIRIEEPAAAAGAEPEPVVLFPGQSARQLARTEKPAPVLTRSPGSSPESTQQSLLSAQPLLDRDEADRALRTALATLQRMGGAR